MTHSPQGSGAVSAAPRVNPANLPPEIRANLAAQTTPDLFGHDSSDLPSPADLPREAERLQETLGLSDPEMGDRFGISRASWCNVKGGRQWTKGLRGDYIEVWRKLQAEALARKEPGVIEVAPVGEQPEPTIEQAPESSTIGESATDVTQTPGIEPDTDRAARMAEAERFLLALDEEAEAFTFQTFDDLESRKSKTLANVRHGSLEACWDWLESLNQTGAGIFVTVNETDGQGRTAKNITRVRAVFADFDPPKTAAAPEQYPLEPMIEVESSPGKRHAYWIVDDLPLEAFKPMQQAIIAALRSDPAPNDLPRVMRLPGFRHMKDPANPAWVRLLSVEQRLPYTTDELERVFRPASPHTQGTHTASDGRAQDNYLAELLSGENVHDAALKIVGRMVRDGVNNATIKATFAVLAEKVAEARGADRAAALMGDELARMIQGARDKGYERTANQGTAPTDHAEPDDTDKLTRITPPWPEPQPITVKVSPEPYPFDALPLTIQMAIKEVFDFVKAPLPMVATSALGALSLAIQAHYDIKRAEKLSGPVSLFTLAIADSGERKSTLDKLFTAAIREYQAAAAERAKPDLKRYAANQMSWKSKQEGLQAAIREAAKKGKPTDELDMSMEQVQMDEPVAPRVPRLILGDETPESLAWSLAKVWPSSGVVSSEAGVIFGAHGMGKDSIMRHLGLLNILWDGGDLPIGRKTSETFTVRDVRLTVALQIQEATLRSFFDRSGGLARGTGFLARFLIAWPESTQGYRLFTEAPEHWPHLEAFNRRLTAVLEQEPPINEDGRLEPSMLTLSPEAKAAWIEFTNTIEVALRETGELYDVRDVASKCADNAARLAALFHIFEGEVGPVSLSAFEGASRVAAWHLTEARRFFGELAIPAELVDAAKLDGWLIEHCRRCRAETVCKRHLRQYGPLRDGARLDLALNELVEMDRVRLAKDGRRTVIEVNPALCGGAS
ncbi:DUF3987 domain-containing protein [Allochromatium vinosum]|uniref:DUF3987 domain-containing protein n=1 Tax=Allochromatium vinosum TaxID=1049 RepID=UPI0019081B2C|nr:DUF3987 domain-containing protein [Allochromatium vinosum]MBK1653358.1 hypothetical protein [Allochromatium vinosum]